MAERLTITDEDYSATQQQLILLAQLVKDMPLQAFLERISRSKAVAPLFNPSLYMRGEAKLELIEQLAVGARQFQKAIPDFEDWVGAEKSQRAVERLQGV